MTILAERSTTKDTLVGMGQIAAAKPPEKLKAVLGSCIGLILYHPRTKMGVMAHIVLPDSAGRAGPPAKFADTALPEMLNVLKSHGTPAHGLIAKFAGGANMFGSSGPLQIGDANTKAVLKSLSGTGIHVAGQDVGGTKGRRVIFDCARGEVVVECAGQSARRL